MHARRNAQPHTHMQVRPLPTHPLSGMQVMCLCQRVLPASILCSIPVNFRGIYQRHLVALLTVCVLVQCVCGAVCWTQWNHCFQNKCSISLQSQSSGVSIYGAHAWPVPPLVFGSAKCSVWDEVISFPSHGRLGDQDVHWALAKHRHLWSLFPPLGNTTDPWQHWLAPSLYSLFTVTYC